MDPFPVQYMQSKVWLGSPTKTFKKDMVRVHVAVGCTIIVMMIFHAIYCNKQALSNV